MNFLSGYKTYITAVGIIVAAAVSFLSGQATMADSISQILTGLGLAALRNGVATGAAK